MKGQKKLVAVIILTLLLMPVHGQKNIPIDSDKIPQDLNKPVKGIIPDIKNQNWKLYFHSLKSLMEE